MIRWLLASVAFLLMAAPASAAEPDARALLDKAQNEGTPKSMQSVMQMDLIDSGGRSKSRLLKIEKVGDDKQLVWFVKPANLKGTAFLRLGDAKSRKMWLYLPAFKKLERIGGAKENESFLGSDFTYADMADRDLDAFNHRYVERTKLDDGTAVHKIESTLKTDDDDALYGKIESYIDAKSGRLLREDLYDMTGDLIKRKTHETFKTVKTYTIPTVIVMKDMGTEHSTRIEMKALEVDRSIPDANFTTQAMQRIRP